MEKLAIKKSEGRKEKRTSSYIDLEVRVKRNLMLLSGDTVNLSIEDNFDLGLNPSISGKIVLLINQTLILNYDDKIKIRFELSSSTGEIGVIRKEE